MPRQLALTITIIFILFLLRLDRKQNPDASLALWIPTVWLLLITSKPLAVWFGTGGISMEDGSSLDRNFITALLLVGLLILYRRNFSWNAAIKDNLWLVLLAGFLLISILWSDMLFVSLKRWVRGVGVALIMAFIIATEHESRKALESVFRRLVYVHIPLSICLVKYYPWLGIEFHSTTGQTMWIGVATQKNGLALRCLFALFFLGWVLMKRWRGRDVAATWYHTYMDVLVVMMAFWLFTGPYNSLTYSATSTAALAAGLMMLFILALLKRQNVTVSASAFSAIVLFFIIYGTVTPFVGGLTLYDVSGFLGRGEDLTGRSEIWAKLLPVALQKPFLGYGFGGFWTDGWRAFIGTSDSHNGYLDTILNTGFVGLVLSALFLTTSARRAREVMLRDADWGIFWFCLVLMAVLHNIAEATLSRLVGLLPMILFVDVVFSTKQQPFIKTKEHAVLNTKRKSVV